MIVTHFFSFTAFCLDVGVGWDIPDNITEISVKESEGRVEVCIAVTGELQRNIEVTASTALLGGAIQASCENLFNLREFLQGKAYTNFNV